MQVKRHESVAYHRPWFVPWLLAAALSAAGCTGPSSRPDAGRLRSHLEALAEGIGPRPLGGAAEEEAAAEVAERMGEAGLRVRVRRLTSAPGDSGEPVRFSGSNVLGSLPARPGARPRILIAAHHDSPDAADPGRGGAAAVAVLLEAAGLLSESPPAAALTFASFTGGEVDRLGERAHLQEARYDLIISLEDLAGRRIVPVPRAGPYGGRIAQRVAAIVRSRDLEAIALDPSPVLPPAGDRAPSGGPAAPPAGAGLLRLRGASGGAPPARVETAALEECVLLAVELVRGWTTREPVDGGAYAAVSVPGRGVQVVPATAMALLYLLQPLLLAGLLTRSRRRERVRAGPAARALCAAAATAALMALATGATARGMQMATGWTRPWSAAPGRHLVGLGIALLLGWTAGVGLSRRMRLPRERGLWEGMTVLLLLLPALALMASVGAEAGVPPVLAATGVLLSVYLDSFALRAGLVALFAWPLARSLAPALGPASGELWGGRATLLLWFALLPGAAYALGWWVQRSRGARRGRASLAAVLLGLGWLALFAWNGSQPAYDVDHPRRVEVRESLDLGTGGVRLRLRSAEPLRGLRTGLAGLPVLDIEARRWVATLPAALPRPGCVAIPEPDGWTRVILLPPPGAPAPVRLRVESHRGRLAFAGADEERPSLEWGSASREGEFAFRVAPDPAGRGAWTGEARFRLRGGLLDLPVGGPDVVIHRRADLRLPLGGDPVCRAAAGEAGRAARTGS